MMLRTEIFSPVFFLRLKIATPVACLIWMTAGGGFASECKVVAYATPDADRVATDAMAREKLRSETEHLVVRFGEEKRSRPSVQPSVRRSAPLDPCAGAAHQGAFGMAATPPRSECKEVTVSDGKQTHRVQVPLNIDETKHDWKAHFDNKRREEASDAWRLGKAIDAADVGAIRKLIAKGGNLPDIEKARRTPPVVRALSAWYGQTPEFANDAQRGARVAATYIRIIRLLLDAGATPDGPPGTGHGTSLQVMASLKRGQPNPPGALELVQLLIDKGATYAVAPRLRNPVTLAAVNENMPLLEILLRQKIVNQVHKDEALYAAARDGSWDAAKRLLAAGANPDFAPPTIFGGCCEPPVADLLLAGSSAPRELLQALVARKPNLNFMLYHGGTPLMAVLHDHELMEAFLKAGADPNFGRGEDGNTALHLAARVLADRPYRLDDSSGLGYTRRSNPEMRAQSVAMLLRHGADPNAVNKNGMTPLMLTSADDAKAISLLLKAGARIGSVDADQSGQLAYYKKSGFPIGPVTWALMKGNETLATALVGHNGKLEESDCGALYYAAQGGAASTLQALLDLGTGQRSVQEKSGQTPLIAAAEAGHATTVRMLLERRVSDVNESTKVPLAGNPWQQEIGGVTPLMAAASRRREDMVRLLLAAGADVGRKDRIGRTALDYAARNGGHVSKDLAQLLAPGASRKAGADVTSAGNRQFTQTVDEVFRARFSEGGVTIRSHAESVNPPVFPGDDSAMEQIPCEQTVAFSMHVDSAQEGRIVVASCTRNATRARDLAVNAERGVRTMLDGIVDPAARTKARENGLEYKAEVLSDGTTLYSFPIIVVGHGFAIIHTAVLYSESRRMAVIVQGSPYPMCQNERIRDFPLCRDPAGAMKALASGMMERQ